MSKDILSLISSKMNTFSKGQKLIANYILSSYDKAAFMTASKLGKTDHVSESTVVRFASELKYDGYPAMQKALQEMIRNRLTSIQRIEVSNDIIGNQDVVTSVMQSDMEKIRMTMEEIDRESFQAAVDTIINAKKIYILGTRSSGSLAGFMSFYFGLMFDNVVHVGESANQEIFDQIVQVGEGDVTIGLSFPRYSRRTVRAINFAHERGSKVVAITDSASNSMAKAADYVLLAKSDMASFVDSLVAPLSLINALLVAIARSKSDVVDHFERLEHIWQEHGGGEPMNQAPVAVISGGAAGMMAALWAKKSGVPVVLIEPNEKLGRKLYITGKGRCNLTNNTTPEGVLANVPRNGRFLYSAVNRFPPDQVMAYFEALGVPLKTERGGRVFPCSDRAADVIDALSMP